MTIPGETLGSEFYHAWLTRKPEIPINREQNLGRNASILKRFDGLRLSWTSGGEEMEEDRNKRKRNKKERDGKGKRNEREKPAKKRERRARGYEMKFSSHPFCVSGGIPVRQEVPPRGIAVAEEKEKNWRTQTVGRPWKRTENESAANHSHPVVMGVRISLLHVFSCNSCCLYQRLSVLRKSH